jgi:hypothetical protein
MLAYTPAPSGPEQDQEDSKYMGGPTAAGTCSGGHEEAAAASAGLQQQVRGQALVSAQARLASAANSASTNSLKVDCTAAKDLLSQMSPGEQDHSLNMLSWTCLCLGLPSLAGV